MKHTAKKIQVYLGLIVLLVVAFFVGYFIEVRREGKPVFPSISISPTPTLFVQPLIYNPGNPIRKRTLPTANLIEYLVDGSFKDGLTLQSEFDDNRVFGNIIIKGDPLERRIPVYFGIASGKVYLGKYVGSFDGNSTWKTVSTKEMFEEVKTGEEIRLKIQVESDPRVYRPLESVLDVIAAEFDANKFEKLIPADFQIISLGIGVIRSE